MNVRVLEYFWVRMRMGNGLKQKGHTAHAKVVLYRREVIMGRRVTPQIDRYKVAETQSQR